MRVNVSSPCPLHIDVKHTFWQIDSERLYQYVYYPKQENFDDFYAKLQQEYTKYVEAALERNERPIILYWRIRRNGPQFFEIFFENIALGRWWGNYDFAWHYVPDYGYATYTINDSIWTRYRVVNTFDDVLRLANALQEVWKW
jgi:hypothetical protein